MFANVDRVIRNNDTMRRAAAKELRLLERIARRKRFRRTALEQTVHDTNTRCPSATIGVLLIGDAHILSRILA